MHTKAFIQTVSNKLHANYGIMRSSKLRARYSQGAHLDCLFFGYSEQQHREGGGAEKVVINSQKVRWEALVVCARPLGSSLLRYHLCTTTSDEHSGVYFASATLVHPDEALRIDGLAKQSAIVYPDRSVNVQTGNYDFIPVADFHVLVQLTPSQ